MSRFVTQVLENGAVIELTRGDITCEETTAIVNAANAHLAGGGGVDGAIHRAGGPRITEECRQIGGCPTGEAVVTSGGRLKARYVIHAVGPIYRDGHHHEADLLAAAYRNSLLRAREKGVESISFPSISTGAYGFPLQLAAPIALGAVIEDVRAFGTPRKVRFVLFDDSTYDEYHKALKAIQ